MPEEIFGKHEHEIELTLHQKLQEIATEATKAATTWADGWRNDRVSITRKVTNKLDEKLEAIILVGLGLTRSGTRLVPSNYRAGWDEIAQKAQEQVKAEVASRLTEDYLKSHKDYDRIMKIAEEEFWRAYRYGMSEAARRAGETCAAATKSQFEKSMTTLIKQGVLDHFAASDGLAELAEEENRKNG